MKHSRRALYPAMEDKLAEFVQRHQDTGVLSDSILWEKANELLDGPTVSLGWVSRFNRRFGIRLRNLHGEAGSVDVGKLGAQRRELQDLLDEYEPKDVFNFDETGLFFRMLPSQTLATSTVRGKKKDKTRLTIGLCSNMDGSEKIAPVVIHRSKSPRCFRGVKVAELPISYYSNPKAWMTRPIFVQWLRDFNLKMHGRRVILLIDNAPGHADVELSNVRVHFLPSNTTSYLQPMDAGIIRAFKCKYKSRFVRWVIAQLEAGGNLPNLDVLSAIKFVVEAWNGVLANTLRNCWCHTGIMSGAIVAHLKQANEPRHLVDLTELTSLIGALELDDPMGAEAYLNAEEMDESLGMWADDAAEHELNGMDSVEREGGDDEDNEDGTPFTHGDAIRGIEALAVYAFGQGLECGALTTLMEHARSMLLSGMRQQPITAFFELAHVSD